MCRGTCVCLCMLGIFTTHIKLIMTERFAKLMLRDVGKFILSDFFFRKKSSLNFRSKNENALYIRITTRHSPLEDTQLLERGTGFFVFIARNWPE